MMQVQKTHQCKRQLQATRGNIRTSPHLAALRLGKQQAQHALCLADPLGQDIRALAHEERDLVACLRSLRRQRPRHQRLSRACEAAGRMGLCSCAHSLHMQQITIMLLLRTGRSALLQSEKQRQTAEQATHPEARRTARRAAA